MRCYNHKTPEGATIAIPHCMPVANSGDIRDCICLKPLKDGKQSLNLRQVSEAETVPFLEEHSFQEVIAFTDNSEALAGYFDETGTFCQDNPCGYSGAVVKFLLLKDLQKYVENEI
jgi:hypothetical protein